MSISYWFPRPQPSSFISWTGDNAAEIQDAVGGSGGGPWTVTDNGDGTITISNSYGASDPITTGQLINLSYPQSGVDVEVLSEYHQQLPGDGPFAYSITES